MLGTCVLSSCATLWYERSMYHTLSRVDTKGKPPLFCALNRSVSSCVIDPPYRCRAPVWSPPLLEGYETDGDRPRNAVQPWCGRAQIV